MITYHLAKKNIRTFNTCSFDSVYVAIAAMYADFENVKKQIDDFTDECTFSIMVSTLFTADVRAAIKHNALLRIRNNLLLSIFEQSAEEYENDLITVDCATNVNYIIPKLVPRNILLPP